MCWLLTGCCGLALIHLSVSLQLYQKPRFYGVKTNQDNVIIYCLFSKQNQPVTVEWYKARTYNSGKNNITKSGTYNFQTVNLTTNAAIIMNKVSVEDSGVYFCKFNEIWGPGTEVKVVRVVNRENAEYRSKMKDGLIVLQGLLLAVCIAAIILRKQKLLEKGDSIYEEPETDHIYEGLAIETCGGGLYEELTVYTQPEVTEAPWE